MDQREEDKIIEDVTSQEYKEGFVTDIRQEFIPKGLNEDIIRTISSLKQEPDWLLEFRLDAFRKWQKIEMPRWGHLELPEIDFQDIIYYAAPKKDSERPKEIDPKLEETFEKYLSVSVKPLPEWLLWMLCSTLFRWLLRSGHRLPSKALSSAASRRLLRSIRTWCVNILPAWFQWETTSSPPLILPCSATGVSAIFPKE